MKIRYRLLWWLEGLWLWLEGAFLNLVIKILPPSEPTDHEKYEHSWIIDGCDYEKVAINLMCFECRSTGIVRNPTKEEWDSVFGQSMEKWAGKSKVTWLFRWAD